MKKIIKFMTLSLVVVLLAGCGKGKEIVSTCTLTNDQSTSGFVLNSTYKIYSKKDVVTKVVTEEIVTSENKSIRSYFETQLNNSYSAASKSYGGYTYSVTNEDDKVVSKVTIDYLKMDLDKFVKDNPSIKTYVNKNNKITLSGAKSMYTSLGAICEE